MMQAAETSPFHAMAKPSGPDCNLDCTYCFYLEKHSFYKETPRHRMSRDTLEAYVREYIAATPRGAEVAFTWQGGEPTLMGLDFFRRAIDLQRRFGKGRTITNSFQTNGLLIDDEWCRFLARHDFLVGLSLDGPQPLHDRMRQTPGGKPSHALVVRALKRFQQHGVRYNVLACVNRYTAREPLAVYEFLCGEGVEFIQFIPVIERHPGAGDRKAGLSLKSPDSQVASAAPPHTDPASLVTEWSVVPADYGTFMNSIFDLWRTRDVGRVHVMNFEWALANLMGLPGASCHHQPTCGRAVVVEHNGDVYSCDHYVYPDYRLGNLADRGFAAMLDSPEQQAFGQAKYDSLPEQCRTCPVLRACWGGCPKHRFTTTPSGEPGLNYLCGGYYAFFTHIAPWLKAIAGLLRAGLPASEIMRAHVVARDRSTGKTSSVESTPA